MIQPVLFLLVSLRVTQRVNSPDARPCRAADRTEPLDGPSFAQRAAPRRAAAARDGTPCPLLDRKCGERGRRDQWKYCRPQYLRLLCDSRPGVGSYLVDYRQRGRHSVPR